MSNFHQVSFNQYVNLDLITHIKKPRQHFPGADVKGWNIFFTGSTEPHWITETQMMELWLAETEKAKPKTTEDDASEAAAFRELLGAFLDKICGQWLLESDHYDRDQSELSYFEDFLNDVVSAMKQSELVYCHETGEFKKFLQEKLTAEEINELGESYMRGNQDVDPQNP